jgi:Tfp pilus assembly protein PilO
VVTPWSARSEEVIMPFLIDNPTTRLKLLGWFLHGAGLLTLLGEGLGAYWMAYLPLANEERACVARIAVLDRLLRNSERIRSEHSRLKESLEKIQQRAGALRQRIPDEPCEAEFLEQMAQATDEVGLEIRDYRCGAVSVKDSHSQLKVHVACAGTYPEICGFLDGLTKMRRTLTVEKMSVTADRAVETYPLDLTFVLYFGAQ